MDTKERLIDLAETHVSQLDSVLKREIGGEAYERTVPGARVHLRLLEQIINALVTRLRNEQASRAAGLSSGRWRVLSAVPASNSAAAAVTEGAALDEDCGPTGRQ